MNNKKKSYLLLTLAGAAACILGVILDIIGYSRNTDGEVTTEDVLILAGFFLIIIGVVLLVNGLMKLLAKKEPAPYQNSDKVKRLALAALFAALAYIGFQFFRFELSIGGEKTAFHLGNTFVVLAALLLGGSWGGVAGAIGLTLADMTSAYVTSAPKTFFLKLCIGLIVGLVAHSICHLSRAHGAKKILRITFLASVCGMAFNIVADPLVGYFYKKYLFGVPQDIATALAKLSSLTTSVNAVLSVILATVLYTSLRPALIKSGLFFSLEKDAAVSDAADTKKKMNGYAAASQK